MARSYSFAIVRLAPDQIRDERINIGVVIFHENDLDVRVSRRLEKIRVFSAALETASVNNLVQELREIDRRFRDAGVLDERRRVGLLSGIGPISLSDLGSFEAPDHAAYEARIAAIVRAMVDPEPAPLRVREKRSRLLTQIKKDLRSERVLARPGEDLTSHRIVSSIEMEEGLVADLVLKNGAMHVVETVDATGESETPRKALGDIGISALVLERARMKYGEKFTTTRLVYSASSTLERIALPSLEAARHQGAELTNWASADDRRKLIHALSSLAEPIPRKRKTRFSAQTNLLD